MSGTPGTPQSSPECWCIRFAPVGQRALLNPASTISLGSLSGTWEELQALIVGIGGTAVDLPIWNAEGQEVGDLRAVEICVPDGEKAWRGDALEISSPFGQTSVPGTWRPEDCETDRECWKHEFDESGLDNTYTNFSDTGASITLTYANFPPDTFSIPDGTGGWSAQVAAISAGLQSVLPDSFQHGTYCTNGCGGLPQPTVILPDMKWRYAGWRTCPGDKSPVKAVYNSDQRENVDLDINVVRTKSVYFDRCIDKKTKRTTGWLYCATGERVPDDLIVDDKPICAIPCGDSYPDVPAIAECPSGVNTGCLFVLDENGEPQLDTPGVTQYWKQCASGLQIQYFVSVGEDTQAEVQPPEGGYFGECDTGEAITPDPESNPTIVYQPKVTCWLVPASEQVSDGNQNAPFAITDDLIIVSQGGQGNELGPFINSAGPLEYSVDGGVTWGTWGNTIGGGGANNVVNTDPLYIRNPVTGTMALFDVTSFSGGGSPAYTATATLSAPEQRFTCKEYPDGNVICCDRFGNATELPPEAEQTECFTPEECLNQIKEYQGKQEYKRRCFERQERCVDTITVFDNGGIVPASNDIVITPTEDCVIDCLIVRILGVAVAGTPQETGISVDVTLADGTVITSPVHGETAGLPVGELDPTINVPYKLPAVVGTAIAAGDSFTIGNIQGLNRTDVGWSNYSNNDNGQVTFSPAVEGVFPDVRILGEGIERYFEITDCADNVRFEDELCNVIDELPFSVEQVPCNRDSELDSKLLQCIKKQLTCCPELDVGLPTLTTGANAGSIISLPHSAGPDGTEDFMIPFSIGEHKCLADTDQPLVVRWCMLHYVDASSVHIGFNVSPVGGVGTIIGSSGAGGVTIGPAVPHGDVTTKQWVDVQYTLAELQAGQALQTSAFGTTNQGTETIIDQWVELQTDLSEQCDCT